ncbi:hypothetical protein BH11CYA1_BH11CYA1_06840 [soil metagenome]
MPVSERPCALEDQRSTGDASDERQQAAVLDSDTGAEAAEGAAALFQLRQRESGGDESQTQNGESHDINGFSMVKGSAALQKVQVGKLEGERDGVGGRFEGGIAGATQFVIVFAMDLSFHLGEPGHGAHDQAFGGDAVALHHRPKATVCIAVRAWSRLELLLAGQAGEVGFAGRFFKCHARGAVVDERIVSFFHDQSRLLSRAYASQAALELLLVVCQ